MLTQHLTRRMLTQHLMGRMLTQQSARMLTVHVCLAAAAADGV